MNLQTTKKLLITGLATLSLLAAAGCSSNDTAVMEDDSCCSINMVAHGPDETTQADIYGNELTDYTVKIQEVGFKLEQEFEEQAQGKSIEELAELSNEKLAQLSTVFEEGVASIDTAQEDGDNAAHDAFIERLQAVHAREASRIMDAYLAAAQQLG